jgi:hypothetical protein
MKTGKRQGVALGFPQGGIMKWVWVFLIVVLVPLSAQAERPSIGASSTIIGGKWNTDNKPRTLRFFLTVDEDGNYLRASIRVYVPRKYPLEAVKKGRCRLVVNNRVIHDMDDFLIYTEYGQDLWFSSLMKRDRAGFAIDWDNDPHVEYATVALESTQGKHTEIWETARAEWFFQKTPVSEQTDHYRELAFHEVCASFPHKDFLEMAKSGKSLEELKAWYAQY